MVVEGGSGVVVQVEVILELRFIGFCIVVGVYSTSISIVIITAIIADLQLPKLKI